MATARTGLAFFEKMRILVKLALCATLPCVLGGAPVSAQSGEEEGASALLSFQQGQELVDFALRHARGPGHNPDCSHLVHTIYARAGLHYTYAQSRSLYYGIDDFERVARPQPGDLIVWLGHVGIVVSPDLRTFFSSVRSGIVTEPWTTDSWKMRGRPRFFRYRIGPATDQSLLAALSSQPPEVEDWSGATQAGDHESDYPLNGKKSAVQHKQHKKTVPQELPAQADVSSSELVSNAFTAVISQRGKPTKQDVMAAIRQTGKLRAQQLIAGQLLDVSRPVSVVQEIEIEKIKIKHESGSITIKLSETLAMADGRVTPGKSWERELSLNRRNDTWEISDPERRLYLPQDQALGVFERQAEIFLQRAPGSADTRSIVKALDTLFDRSPASAQSTAMK